MAVAETARMLVELGLDASKYNRGAKSALQATDRLETGIGRIGKGAGQLSSGLTRAGTRIAAGLGVGLGAAAKAAIDWEDAFTGVAKTVDATLDTSLDEIARGLRDLATTMPTTAADLAAIAEAGGAMGIKADDILAFTKQVAILGATTDVAVEDAAMALGQLGTILGLTGDEFDNFSAALVALGNAGTTTESKILEVVNRAGSAAQLFGLSKDETVGWAAAVANLGLGAELTGTALQKILVQALPKFISGSKTLETVTGKTAKQLKKAYEKDAGGALESLIGDLAKLEKGARLEAVQQLFGKGSGTTQVVLGLAESFEKNLVPSLDLAGESWIAATAAQEEFDKKNASVKSGLMRLKNGVYEAAITLGDGFVPALGRAADKLSTFLKDSKNQSALKSIGEDIGKSIDDIDWKEVLDGARSLVDVMKVALDWAKRLYDMFNLLPTPIKGAAAGFVALNKLSGGLIGGGLGNILGGLLGPVLRNLGASLPGVGKAFVQPVFVTNMPIGGLGAAGGAAGAAGKGMSAARGLATAATVGLAAAAIAAAVETYFAQNQASTDQAAEIKAGVDASIMGKSLPELRAALAGVDQGINDLQSNPLHAIVQGEALTTLQTMRKDLTNQITNLDRLREQANRTKDDTVAATERVKQATDETKRETSRGTGVIQSAVARSAETIRNGFSFIPPPKVEVNLSVSPTTINRTTQITNRYGSTSGDRFSNHQPGRPGAGP